MTTQATDRGSPVMKKLEEPGSRFSEYDAYLFKQGSHTRLQDKLGAHLAREGEVGGVYFSVWAPNARSVSVTGDFNEWRPDANPLRPREDGSGIWEGFVAGASDGDCYKYRIASRYHGYEIDKSDPFAFYCEAPPRTASRVWRLDYDWRDGEWMKSRRRANALDAPDVHLRGAPGIVAARPAPAGGAARATASWRTGSPTTSRRWASRTSS